MNRVVAAWSLAAVLAGAAVLSASSGLLGAGIGGVAFHQVQVPESDAGSGLPTDDLGLGGPDQPPLPPAGPDAAVRDALPVLGLAVEDALPEDAAAGAFAMALPGDVMGAAALADPHDAMLLATGSASGIGLIYQPSMPAPVQVGPAPPDQSPAGVVRLAESLAASPDALRDDLQLAVLRGAQAEGLGVHHVNFEHDAAEALEQVTLLAYQTLGIEATADARARLHDSALALDPEFAAAAALILDAVVDGQVKIQEQMRQLPRADYQLLLQCAHPGSAADRSCPDPERARDIALHELDRTVQANAALAVLSAVQQALPHLRDAGAVQLAASQVGTSDAPDLFSDPYRLIEIGSSASDIYYGNTVNNPLLDSASQLLTIDVGGEDLYLARAGGTMPNPNIGASGGPQLSQSNSYSFGTFVSVTIDTAGNDMYSGGSCYQGCGSLGVGLLIDLAGDDRYSASSQSQGYALEGVGLLLDYQGNDYYSSTYRSQGHGFLGGLGMLVDLLGSDTYGGQQLMQGSGSTQGAGLLIDTNGVDSYTASFTGNSISQGASHLLGLGVLADGQGNDKYTLSAGGGRGWIYAPTAPPYTTGVGVFVDLQGIDTYVGAPGFNGSTWYQGSLGFGEDKS
jgi:hypothetical protein